MANIGKQNFLVVEINPTTHETRAIPFEKCFIYDNVSVNDLVNRVAELESKLSKIDDFENVLKVVVESVQLLNTSVTQTSMDVTKIFEMLKGETI